MAFSTTITHQGVFGSRKVVFGTFTNGNGTDTGGTVSTGLSKIDYFSPEDSGTGTVTYDSRADFTNRDGGDIRLYTAGGVDGCWFAMGK